MYVKPRQGQIDALHEVVHSGLVFPTAETELHVCSMLQIAMTYRQPTHAFLGRYAERVLGLITRGLDTNQCVAAAGLLLTYYDWFAPEKGRLLVGFVQPLLRAKDQTPFNRLWWLLSEANHYYHEGQPTRASALFAEARTIASSHGILPNHALLLVLNAMEADTNGLSLRQIDAMVEALDPARRQEEQNIMSTVIPTALRRGDHARALGYSERMLRSARDTGHRTCELEAHAWVATALCESGHAEAALLELAAARDIIRGVEAPKIEFHHLLIEANTYLKMGESESAHDALRRAFALARAHGYTIGFQPVPHILARLCGAALHCGIEREYALRLIQVHRLAPPPGNAPEAWPWQVRVSVLGHVAIDVEGAPLVFNSKTQKKPLELLKALISKGPRGASQAILAQQLWPDSEDGGGASALRMSLHRLRKLLRSDDTVVVSEGKVRLNDRLCWVDAWSLEVLCGHIEAMNKEVLAGQGDRLLALYRGAAFDGESEQAWMLLARERWRGKFLRAVDLIGTEEERGRAWIRALEIYRRGLEADPLNEDLYCRSMNCYLQQGKAAEAYSTYRRCREMLSVMLGARPSPRTEAMRQRAAELASR